MLTSGKITTEYMNGGLSFFHAFKEIMNSKTLDSQLSSPGDITVYKVSFDGVSIYVENHQDTWGRAEELVNFCFMKKRHEIKSVYEYKKQLVSKNPLLGEPPSKLFADFNKEMTALEERRHDVIEDLWACFYDPESGSVSYKSDSSSLKIELIQPSLALSMKEVCLLLEEGFTVEQICPQEFELYAISFTDEEGEKTLSINSLEEASKLISKQLDAIYWSSEFTKTKNKRDEISEISHLLSMDNNNLLDDDFVEKISQFLDITVEKVDFGEKYYLNNETALSVGPGS